MAVYEVTTEDGSVYQVTTEDPTPSIWQNPVEALTSKDWWLTKPSGEKISPKQAVLGPAITALNSLTFGTGDEIIAGASAGLDSLFGDADLSTNYDSRLAELRGAEKNFSQSSPTASLGISLAGALKSPIFNLGRGASITGNATKAAAEGAAYGGIFGFNQGEGGLGKRLKSATEGAAFGSAFGGGASIAGAGLKGSAKIASNLGRKSQLSAYGLTQSKIQKAYERFPALKDAEGQVQNPWWVALTDFFGSGGGKKGLNPQGLVEEVGEQSKALNIELARKLQQASSKQKNAIVPEFKLTSQYVEGLPGAVKADAVSTAEELITKTLNNTDGTLSALQREKVGLDKLINETAWGTDANPVRTNIYKRLRADLRTAIESGYSSVTGKPAEEIAQLNQRLALRELLHGGFETMRAAGEKRDPVGWLMQNMRTSGGFGALGIATGSAALPVVGALASTPTGRNTIGKALTTGAKAASTTADQISRVPPSIFGILGARSSSPDSQDQALIPAAGEADNLIAPRRGIDLQSQQYKGIEESLSQSPSPHFAPSSLPTQDPLDEAFKSLALQGNMDMAESTYRAPPELVQALIQQESAGKANAVASKGARGLMQIMPETAKEIAAELGLDSYDLNDPETNQMMGEHYLNKMIDMFDGDYKLALAGYNAGPGAVQKWIKKYNTYNWDEISTNLKREGKYKETREYVPMILNRVKKINPDLLEV